MGRVALEIAVVLIGIFGAFRVEEVRDARRARTAEAAQLAALVADFRESKARLEEVITLEQHVLSEAIALLRFLEGHTTEAPERIGNVLSFYRFEPVQGAYQAMLASGDVTRLTNQELASALATFAADIDAGFEDENESRLLFLEALRSVSHLGAAVIRTEGRALIGLPPKVLPVTAFDNPAFVQALAGRALMEHNRLAYYERLRNQLDHILGLLEEEQGSGSPGD